MAEQTMVERVALAIGRVVTRGEVEPRKGWLEAARAAIEAMRACTFDDCMNVGAEINLTPGQVDLVWVRMIDAALKEPSASPASG